MNVYYDPGFLYIGSGRQGRKQAAGWRFEYADMRCIIPAVYRFPRGMVFDILSFTDEARLREFFSKYAAIEETLTSSQQQRSAMQEHPFQPVPIHEVWLNGTLAQGGVSYSHVISVPGAPQDDSINQLRGAYSALLGGNKPFACQRVRVDYPETTGGLIKLRRRLCLNRIKNMRLATSAVQWFHPLDISFELSDGAAQKQINFLEPVTGTQHTLYISEAKVHEFALTRRLYAALAHYEIDPELPEGAAINFSCNISSEEHLSAPELFPGDGATASAIGIIGGSDGPTAIFMGMKGQRQPKGPHDLPLHTCFSVPSFKKNTVWTFTVEGLYVKHIDGQVFILGGE